MKTLKQSILSIAIGLALVAGVSYAWTGAPGDPPTNNTAAPINVGPIMQTRSGALNFDGIVQFNASTPMIISAGASAGNVLTSDADGKASWQPSSASDGVPSGAVMFFNKTDCTLIPGGWSPVTEAEGRYIVGLNPGGTLKAIKGSALNDKENRPTGAHTHKVGNLRHGEGSSNYYMDYSSGGSLDTGDVTGGAVHGTNAPYIQFLVCVKD